MEVLFPRELGCDGLRTRIGLEINRWSELAVGLHVLSRPGFHGPFLRWALNTRAEMRADVVAVVDQLYPILTGLLPHVIPDPAEGIDDLSTYRRWLKAQPLAGFQADIAQVRERWTQHYDAKMARHSEWAAMDALREAGFWDQLTTEADTLRDMWLIAVEHFWHTVFEVFWHDMAPLLGRAQATATRALERHHPVEWLGRLSPQTQAESGRGSLRFLIPWSGRYEAPLDIRVVVRLSVLALPHTLVHWQPPVLTVVCAAPEVREFAGPLPFPPRGELLLSVLGDASRLEIFRYLIGKALTPGAVAHALRLTPSTVTRHLAFLQEAGLVERERQGHFIFYRARPDILAEVLEPLLHLNKAADPALTTWFG